MRARPVASHATAVTTGEEVGFRGVPALDEAWSTWPRGERPARLREVEYNTLESALASVDLRPDDVDYLSFDHLHVQDVRMLVGGTDHEAIFPRARLISQRREFDTFRSIHPTQWAWYVPGGTDGVDPGRLIQVDARSSWAPD